MRKIDIILVLILVVFLYENLAIKFKMTNVVCKSYNESWVTIDHCRLRALRRDKTVLNINLTIHYPANNVHLRLQVLKKANGYKPWIINSTVDGCAFMRKPNEPVAKIVFGMIRNISTVNHSCPFMGLQQVKDFYLTPEQIPLPLPTGDYALFLTWIFLGIPQFITNVYFTYAENLINQ